jgi:hypothetical protein
VVLTVLIDSPNPGNVLPASSKSLPFAPPSGSQRKKMPILRTTDKILNKVQMKAGHYCDRLLQTMAGGHPTMLSWTMVEPIRPRQTIRHHVG